MSSKAQSKEKFKSKIGGQAVIEGVMMRGIHKAAMACRLPDGTIDLEEWAIKGGKDTPWYRKTPFVRGIFSFLTSLIDGYKCLTRSAEKQMTEEDEEEQTKFEQWLDDKLGDKLGPIITAIFTMPPGTLYFRAFSIRFSKSRRARTQLPVTITS